MTGGGARGRLGLEDPREQMTRGGLRAAPALGLGGVGKSREGEGDEGTARQGRPKGGRASQET
jgi:hypothetical protein